MPNYTFSPALLEQAVAAAGSMSPGKGDGAGQSKDKFPWSVILPIAISLFGNLFGGDDEEEQRRSEDKRYEQWMAMIKQILGKQSQSQVNPLLLGGANTATLQAVLNNMNRTTNWGWPEGMRIGDPLSSAGGMGSNNLLQNLLKNLQGSGIPTGLPGPGTGNISLPGTIRRRV